MQVGGEKTWQLEALSYLSLCTHGSLEKQPDILRSENIRFTRGQFENSSKNWEEFCLLHRQAIQLSIRKVWRGQRNLVSMNYWNWEKSSTLSRGKQNKLLRIELKLNKGNKNEEKKSLHKSDGGACGGQEEWQLGGLCHMISGISAATGEQALSLVVSSCYDAIPSCHWHSSVFAGILPPAHYLPCIQRLLGLLLCCHFRFWWQAPISDLKRSHSGTTPSFKILSRNCG